MDDKEKICANCKYFRLMVDYKNIDLTEGSEYYMDYFCGVTGQEISYDETCDDYEEREIK